MTAAENEVVALTDRIKRATAWLVGVDCGCHRGRCGRCRALAILTERTGGL